MKIKKFTLRLTEQEEKILNRLSKENNKSKNEILKLLLQMQEKELEKNLKEKEEIKNIIKDFNLQIKKFGTVLNEINKNFYAGKSEGIEKISEEMKKLWQYIKVLKE